MQPLGHLAIRGRHLGDLAEHFTFLIRTWIATGSGPQLLDVFTHRCPFFVGETLGRVTILGRAPGGFSRFLAFRFPVSHAFGVLGELA
jgi:hypothetical protein